MRESGAEGITSAIRTGGCAMSTGISTTARRGATGPLKSLPLWITVSSLQHGAFSWRWQGGRFCSFSQLAAFPKKETFWISPIQKCTPTIKVVEEINTKMARSRADIVLNIFMSCFKCKGFNEFWIYTLWIKGYKIPRNRSLAPLSPHAGLFHILIIARSCGVFFVDLSKHNIRNTVLKHYISHEAQGTVANSALGFLCFCPFKQYNL